MKHVLQRIRSVLKHILLFFRVIVTLKIGMNEDSEQKGTNSGEGD